MEQLIECTILLHGIRFTIKTDMPESLEYMLRYLNAETTDCPWTPLSLQRTVAVTRAANVGALADEVERLGILAGTVETYHNTYYRRYHMNAVEVFLPLNTRDHLVTRAGSEISVSLLPTLYEQEKQVLRIIREVSRRTLENAGALFFHAGCVATSRGGVMVMGPACAGKTTLLLSLLQLPDTRFLGNDRTFVWRSEGRFIAGYTPLPVRIGLGTCSTWEPLKQYIRNGGMLRRPGEVGLDNLDFDRFDIASGSAQPKLEVEPAELSEMTGVGRVSRSILKTVILPKIEPGSMTPVLRSVSARDAFDLLTQSCCTPTDDLWPSPWIEPWERSPAPEALIAAMSHSLEIFEMRYGTDWNSRLADSLEAGLDLARLESGGSHGR
jgi:hypothetical protein